MFENKYILGLDIGISSVGWGLLQLDEKGNPFRIIDVGSRIFAPGEVEKTGDSRAKERREKRDARRVTRRREFRVDRVRNLLYESGFLSSDDVKSDIVSEKNEELTVTFNDLINKYYKGKETNPYKLKVEALDRKLTDEELCIILVHYAKKRGYKSNREENKSNNDESGKVLGEIKANEKIMVDNNYRTISEMYVKDEKFKNKIKNSPNNYKVSVTNEMYNQEINLVLDSQIKFGLISEEFKNCYLDIYNSRRHYSEGPGWYYVYDKDGNRIKKRSSYGGNLIEKMTGKCDFDGNPRAPKRAFSSEVFVALGKLINLRYKSNETDNDYVGLTKDEINILIERAKEKNTITYQDVIKLLNQTGVKFKSLQLSKREYVKVLDSLKKKLNIDSNDRIDIKLLEPEDRELYDNLYNKALYSHILVELKGYHELRQIFEKTFSKNYWENVRDNYELLDELALFCTNYKLEDDIKQAIINSNVIPNELSDENFISALPNFKDHLMLSTELIRKLIPIMLEGYRYDEAMEKLNISHSNKNIGEKKDLLIPINKSVSITNQRVIRSLTQARKVINAVIKKYGSPAVINIETARELAKTKQERNEIEKRNIERKFENENIKKFLVEEFSNIFPSVDKVRGVDLLKYRLWKEQNEFCAYSLKKITIQDLFINNTVQIDHILPYSRTYNDNYLNKTLVFTKENQDKGNKTPYEWFGNTSKWDEYEIFINSLNISQNKKDNYLIKKLDFDMEREMRDQNLNDTKYISKELASLIKAYLNVGKVNVYQGAITAKLRARWGLNRLTHSYISKNYVMPDSFKQDINKDRDNHLHHAMDALIIASITQSLQQKITLYEKFSRYIDGLTENIINNIYSGNVSDVVEEFYNDETGEINEVSLKEYLRNEVSKEHIYYSKKGVAKLKFPLPYERFADEVKLRVYERDLEVLRSSLSMYPTYTKQDVMNAHVLMPSIAKTKVSGKMHEETYYGIRKFEEKDAEGNEIVKKYKTIKKSVASIKRKDLENLPYKDAGAKDIYNAIDEWLGEYEDGEKALKAHNGKYPVNKNDVEKKEIKKIRLYSPYKNTGHMVNNSNVEKGGIYRINVYKSKDDTDEKLYFAALDIYDIKKIESMKKGKGINLDLKLEFGQGKNNIILPYQEIITNYDLIMVLNKNDLIEVTNNNNEKVIGYVVGCSSGKIEIKSVIGDGYDLVGEGKIFNSIRDRYQITVSTIKSIRKLSINTLGEINGL